MPETLNEIKALLESNIGKPITIVAQIGRKKVMTRTGILKETYPSLFIIELENDSFDRLSYSYTDALTHNIEISFA